MSKRDFLQKKYEEINKLKNSLSSHPTEHTEKIINSIKRIADEITAYLEKRERKGKSKRYRSVSERVFTLEELSNYNGENGRLSYVAVDGVVYDVSRILQWKSGNHYGLFAGQDLTNYYSSFHLKDKDVLKNAKKVGILETKRVIGELPKYTLEQLSKFDGLNGRKSYVAVDGIIYDVTDAKTWVDGKHYGVIAGRDLSQYFNVAHKQEMYILDKLGVVGVLI